MYMAETRINNLLYFCHITIWVLFFKFWALLISIVILENILYLFPAPEAATRILCMEEEEINKPKKV